MASGPVKILFLYAEVMGYTLSVLNSFAKNHHCEVYVVYWDEPSKKRSLFQFNKNDYDIHFLKRSDVDKNKINLLINQVFPDIICVSGWMDKAYLKACRFARKKNIIVVCLLDTQWRQTLRQQFSALASRFFYRQFFSHMWVAGIYQYEYAKKLGFPRNKILTGMYTADTDKFESFYQLTKNFKKEKFPHVFLYIGRFIERKGIMDLVTAYQNTKKIKDHDWKLVLIGEGEIKSEFTKIESIIVKDFVQPNELVDEIKDAGVFCLPSRFEAWGVVIHEFATAGLPLITSDECGAATEFVRNGYNGYTYPSGNVTSLTNKMLIIINTSDEGLWSMGEKSNELSKHITPMMNSSSILNILEDK